MVVHDLLDNLLWGVVGFCVGAASATLWHHRAQGRPHRHQVVGVALIALAVVTVLQGVRTEQTIAAAINRRMDCTNDLRAAQRAQSLLTANSVVDVAHLVSGIRDIVTTPVERRTPQQYRNLDREFSEYLASVEILKQRSEKYQKVPVRC